MKNEVTRDYEWDLRFFLKEAAKCTIEKNNTNLSYERVLNSGSIIAFKGAAFTMVYRLTSLCFDKYGFDSVDRVMLYIDARINQLIKERTNEAKSKLHESKKAHLA